MNKKLGIVLGSSIIGVSSIVTPLMVNAQVTPGGGFNNQYQTQIGVADGNKGGKGSDTFIVVLQNGINYVLGFLGLISIIVLLWGGFLMVTAAGDDGKYKKGFTILKQAAIGLIMIGLSALIVNLIFWFVNANTDTAGANSGGGN